MLERNNEVVYLHNLIDQIEALEVIYDGMVSNDIIKMLRQAKTQAQTEERQYKEKWLDEEYKEPKGEKENDD